eukprot:5030515-Prymnesium_polylepis.1
MRSAAESRPSLCMMWASRCRVRVHSGEWSDLCLGGHCRAHAAVLRLGSVGMPCRVRFAGVLVDASTAYRGQTMLFVASPVAAETWRMPTCHTPTLFKWWSLSLPAVRESGALTLRSLRPRRNLHR